MRTPDALKPLFEEGLIDSVVRPLQAGKEAQVYLVRSGDELRAAKVYLDAQHRSFKNRSIYAEGRTVRNSRDQRAMNKRSRHGRERDEQHWKSAEADVIYRLHNAGVRVPVPYGFLDGVLLMEAVLGDDGEIARRLAEFDLEREVAHQYCKRLIGDVVRMLSVGIVHGDLSLFNVLLGEDGPVVIDFPQAIDAARNNNARDVLIRDVANLTSQLMPDVPASEKRFGHEMWDLYERQALAADTELTGRFDLPQHEVDAEALLFQMLEIEEDSAFAAEEPEYAFEPPPSSAARVVKPSVDADAIRRRAQEAAKKIPQSRRRKSRR